MYQTTAAYLLRTQIAQVQSVSLYKDFITHQGMGQRITLKATVQHKFLFL